MTTLTPTQTHQPPSTRRPRELGETLEHLAAQAGQRFHAEGVVLRLYNRRTTLFEARAFAGYERDDVAELSNVDVSEESWEIALGIGGALAPRRFGPEHAASAGSLGIAPARSFQASQAPAVYVVPLRSENEVLLGYVGLVTAGSAEVDGAALERFGRSATLAVENALLRARVQRQGWQLSVARRDLKELGELKTNFIHSVSHELRTPVTSILAYAEALAAAIEGGDADTLKNFVEVIRNEGGRLTQVVDNVLDVSRLEQGRHGQEWSDFDLIKLCHDSVRRMEQLFHEKSLELKLEAPSGRLTVHADRGGVEQLLTNLLDNALKFTPTGGVVRMCIEERGSNIHIEVEDTGIGIPSHELDRVFDRFHQVDGSTTRGHGGQGLGLAISRDIVMAHGGRIWADPNVDAGARFIVVLPRNARLVRVRGGEDLEPQERMPLDEFLRLVCSLVADVTSTRVVSLMLVDPEIDALRIEAALGLPADVVHETLARRGEGVAGRVWATGRSILVENVGADERFAGRQKHDLYPARSLLSVPLTREGQVVGVINVNNRADGSSLNNDDRLLLEGMSDRIAHALRAFTTCRQSHRQLSRIRQALGAILQVQHERWTPRRAWVTRVALQTGRQLNLVEADLRVLAYALRVYDMGMAKVGDSLLHKMGSLSPGDRRRIDDHVQHSVELGLELEESSKVRQILYHHHENVDGSGYPDGLQGEAIPVVSRLLRLVDTLAALLHERPFRPALDLEKAVAFIRERLGAEFCPRVAEVFLDAIENDRSAYESMISRARGHESGDPAEPNSAPSGAGPQEEA